MNSQATRIRSCFTSDRDDLPGRLREGPCAPATLSDDDSGPSTSRRYRAPASQWFTRAPPLPPTAGHVVKMFQIRMLPSSPALITCLPSGLNRTDDRLFECPTPVAGRRPCHRFFCEGIANRRRRRRTERRPGAHVEQFDQAVVVAGGEHGAVRADVDVRALSAQLQRLHGLHGQVYIGDAHGRHSTAGVGT